MEVGFEAVVGRTVRGVGGAEAGAARAALEGAGALLGAAEALDAARERQRAVAQHAAAFAPPRPLPLRAAPAEQDAEMRALADEPDDDAARAVRAELAQRLLQLEAAARQLRAECQESAKTLDAAEAELVRQVRPAACCSRSRAMAADSERSPPADGGAGDRAQLAVRRGGGGRCGGARAAA